MLFNYFQHFNYYCVETYCIVALYQINDTTVNNSNVNKIKSFLNTYPRTIN